MLTSFWAGLFFGWIIGSVGTGLVLLFVVAGTKRADDWPTEGWTPAEEILQEMAKRDREERLKGRRE